MHKFAHYYLIMVTVQDVDNYLKELKTKMNIFDILYLDDRNKNQQTLHDLEISPLKRTEIIRGLKAKDYSEGPVEEKMRGLLPMWVFGKKIKKKEIYIKISLGIENNPCICISFHIAEHPMKYPFK